MSEFNLQKKKVVVLCASIAALSASGPVLLKGHPKVLIVWVGLMSVAVVYAIVEFAKLKGQER